MICCGYIVTERPYVSKELVYAGVDCNAWPIEFLPKDLSAFSQKLHLSSEYDIHQPFLLSYTEAYSYQKRCCSLGIITRMLYCKIFCEHDNIIPVVYPMDSFKHRYLGIDFAYPNETYFSVMRNEMILQKTSFHRKWKTHINQYGLLPSPNICISFAKERQCISRSVGTENYFECGPFDVIEVYEMI